MPTTCSSPATTAGRAPHRCRRSSTPDRRGTWGSRKPRRSSSSMACATASTCQRTAEAVRRILAGLGCRSMDDAIGRVDLLERVDHPEVPRAQMLDLSLLLTDPLAGREEPRRRTVQRNDRPGVESLDDEILSTLEPR